MKFFQSFFIFYFSFLFLFFSFKRNPMRFFFFQLKRTHYLSSWRFFSACITVSLRINRIKQRYFIRLLSRTEKMRSRLLLLLIFILFTKMFDKLLKIVFAILINRSICKIIRNIFLSKFIFAIGQYIFELFFF